MHIICTKAFHLHKILDATQNFVINGDAGTGKTVLLTHLIARILNQEPDFNIGVVVQPNWEKTGKEIFRVYGMNKRNLTVTTSTKMIKSGKKYDVVVVDESHKLSRRYGKQHPSFNAVYKINGFEKCQSHLEILKALGKQIILMYDVLQAIRPANVTRKQFHQLTSEFEQRYLTTQFRIQAPKGKKYTSDDYINGIKYLLYKDTGLLKYTNFDSNFNRDVFKDSTPDAYFGYFTEQPLHNLIDWVEEDRNFHPEHVNRVLAGLVEPWQQKDGKDKSIMHWHEGDIYRRWNSSQENWINSKDEDAEDQIGSVFAVQGIDLNKVGVLIGNDLQVDPNGHLFGNPEHFFNTNGKFTKTDFKAPKNRKEFTFFVLNIYYVLLTRGIDGIRLGFWKNNEFKMYMEETLDII
ncbi:DNA/RNA helicase domain-containing protein [Secundilactobacillus silagei]|nr:DNA/RNA helicase domain-containing protein [Secundilactobacillus silagei]